MRLLKSDIIPDYPFFQPCESICLVSYDTPEALLCAFALTLGDDATRPMREVFGIEVAGDLNLQSLLVDGAVRVVKEAGIWGFALPDGSKQDPEPSVHLWFSPEIKPTKLLHLIAHELGHICTDRGLLTNAADNDIEANERMADAFGWVALQAVSWGNALLRPDPASSFVWKKKPTTGVVGSPRNLQLTP